MRTMLHNAKQSDWWRTIKLTPSRPTKFSEVWLGALGATVLIWLGASLLDWFVVVEQVTFGVHGAFLVNLFFEVQIR